MPSTRSSGRSRAWTFATAAVTCTPPSRRATCSPTSRASPDPERTRHAFHPQGKRERPLDILDGCSYLHTAKQARDVLTDFACIA